MMEKWLKLDTKKLNQPRHEKTSGVTTEIFLSPYDIPHAIRGSKEGNKYIIEFKYIEEREPLETEVKSHNVELKVGRNSGRLYVIEITSSPTIEKEGLEIKLHFSELSEAFIALRKKPHASRRNDNYDLAKKVLIEKGDELFVSAA